MAAILNALEIGYRHIDTAQSYDTEASVGEAARRSGIAALGAVHHHQGGGHQPRQVAVHAQRRAQPRDDRARSGRPALDPLAQQERCRALRGLHAGARRGAAPWACPADRRLELSDRPAGAHRAPARPRRDRDEPGGDPPLPAGAEARRLRSCNGLHADRLPAACAEARSRRIRCCGASAKNMASPHPQSLSRS